MSETMERLKKQGDEDAEKCIRIYNALLDLDNGKVWSSKWNVLVTTKRIRESKFFGDKDAWGLKPTAMGEIFIKGL